MSLPRGSRLRAAMRLAAYLGWTAMLLPVQMAAVATRRRRLAERLPVFYHRHCLPLLGLEVEIRGRMSEARPTLFVCNHSSYADITVLGALIPGSFVAKSEVADWPFFGLLAKLQRTVFVDRQSRRAAHHRDAMQQRLDAGDNLILFPEGTSNDGNRVLPFKSALFSVAERSAGGRPLTVQPVSIAYARLDGMPIGYGLRPCFAWYGGMSLAPHLLRMVGLGRVRIVVEFHPAMTLADCGSRREMARRCHAAVASGVAAALFGRRDAGLDSVPADISFAEFAAASGDARLPGIPDCPESSLSEPTAAR